jgi:hypothetical protein
MKKMRVVVVSAAMALGIGSLGGRCFANAGGGIGPCFITTEPDCSVYFAPTYYSCESGGIYSITYSGGLPMPKCTSNSYGALGCMNGSPSSCTFASAITWCDGTVNSNVITVPLTQTMDDGRVPCP